MSDHIIPLPPESRWDRFVRPFKKIHPSVQAVIVAGVFGIFGTWFGYHLQSTGLNQEVSSLKEKVEQQDAIIRNKTQEIQRLETQLMPFRTIAIQKFTGDDKEAMHKLADYVISLQERVAEQTRRISELREQVGQAKKLSEKINENSRPRTLSEQTSQFIISYLQQDPKIKVEIGAYVNNTEAFGLANQIKALFESAGYKFDRIVPFMQSIPQKGIAIKLKKPPTPGIDKAIAKLLQSQGQSPNVQKLDDDAKSDMVIHVYNKP